MPWLGRAHKTVDPVVNTGIRITPTRENDLWFAAVGEVAIAEKIAN